MPYLLDSNIFIQAKNLHYGFDFCPAFWDWIESAKGEGRVISIEKVGDELRAGSDDLATWAAAQGSDFFLAPDPTMLNALPQVSGWVSSQGFTAGAVSTFLQVADYYLISRALAHRDIVVTHEVPTNSVNKVKIPTVCIGMGIRFMNPFEMLRVEKARFVLGP